MTPKKQAAKPDDAADRPDFEKSLERLEAIVREMESGSIGLEKMIERFEEGQKLIELCTNRLDEVERRIEILVRKGDKIEAEPFDESSESGKAPAEGAGKKDNGDLF